MSFVLTLLCTACPLIATSLGRYLIGLGTESRVAIVSALSQEAGLLAALVVLGGLIPHSVHARWDAVRFGSWARTACLSVVSLVAVLLAGTTIALATARCIVGDAAQSSWAIDWPDPWVVPLKVASSCVVAPVLEELVFRAGLQRCMREAFGPASSVTLAGALFVLAHDRVSATRIFAAMLFGLVYERDRDVVCCMIVHSACNMAVSAFQAGLVFGERWA